MVYLLIMLMQTILAGGMEGGVASAVARALGAGRRCDAQDLVLQALLRGCPETSEPYCIAFKPPSDDNEKQE